MNKELEKGVKMTPQEEKKESIRQEDSKALKKYLVVLVLCGVIGGFTGFFGAKASDSHMLAEIVKTIADGFYMVVPYVPFVGTTIAIIVSVILYRKSRKTFEQWDGEDEEVMEGIERNLSIVLFIHAAVMVIFYAFIALGFSYFSRIHEIEDIPWAAVILFIIGFIETTVYILIAEQKVVNMEKEMNPEMHKSITKLAGLMGVDWHDRQNRVIFTTIEKKPRRVYMFRINSRDEVIRVFINDLVLDSAEICN